MYSAVLNKLIVRLRQSGLTATVAGAAHDPAQLALLFRHFSIGSRLTYLFEQRRELQFSTLILGYRINHDDLYDQRGIEMDDQELPCAVRIDARTVVPLERIRHFRLILPDTSSHQAKLDYLTRAELGPDGPLSKGVILTLRARSVGRSVPIVETTVDDKETLVDGPFAGQGVVLVEPDLDMIRVVDNRRKPRIRAAVDATLLLAASTATSTIPVRIVDFSDETIRVRAKSVPLPALKAGSPVELEFVLGESAEAYRLRGKLERQSEQTIVVRFFEFFLTATAHWRKIEKLDVLEIKTALLNAGR